MFPSHDQTHGADAFRMAAIGIKALDPSGSSKLTKDQIREMRQKYLGY